jgi:hypothetical protein
MKPRKHRICHNAKDVTGQRDRIGRCGGASVGWSPRIALTMDTNTISLPNTVAPGTATIGCLGNSFTSTVPACSLTVVTLG